MSTRADVNIFSTNLPRYIEPFSIEPITKVSTHTVTGAKPSAVEVPVVGPALTPPDKFKVTVAPLAETQMSYDNFPEMAKVKVMEII